MSGLYHDISTLSTTKSGSSISLRGIAAKRTVQCNFREHMDANFNGKRLAQARNAFGWTQTELAHQVVKRFPSFTVSPQAISAYELDTRTPSFEVAIALAVVLETSLDYLSNITEYDRGVSGNDEVLVVVRTEQQKTDMQAIAYPFLELQESDRRMVLDLVRRLHSDGNDTTTTINEKRFRRLIASLSDKLGGEVIADLAAAYGVDI